MPGAMQAEPWKPGRLTRVTRKRAASEGSTGSKAVRSASSEWITSRSRPAPHWTAVNRPSAKLVARNSIGLPLKYQFQAVRTRQLTPLASKIAQIKHQNPVLASGKLAPIIYQMNDLSPQLMRADIYTILRREI